MLDRSRPPQIKEIGHLELPEPRRWQLRNGIPVYSINLGTQEVVKIELIFLAGRPYEAQKLVARATANLLKEGTQRLSSEDIAEHFDYYGATLSMPFQMDTADVILYSLNRHLPALLPVLTELLRDPAFPQRELKAFVRRNQQLLLEDLSKTDVLTYRQITECFFGIDHPYGYNTTAETYDALERQHLFDHFERYYHAGNALLILSGCVDSTVERLVDEHLGQLRAGPPVPPPQPMVLTTSPRRVDLVKPGAVQTSIRIGRRLFSRHHEDAHGFYVLNAILGGYFGSRLMENIRERKGYTYNISSSYDAMRFDGSFQIGADVGNEYTDRTLTEIRREIDKLCSRSAPRSEMEMLRNYLMGTLLAMLDGPFNMSETVRTLLTEDLPLTTFADLADTVRSITPRQIRDLARQYLQPEDLWTVVCGPE